MTSLKVIEQVGVDAYRIQLEVSGTKLAFELRVENRHEIDVVSWGNEFQDFMWRNANETEPLLAAVLAFHQAQRCRLVI